MIDQYDKPSIGKVKEIDSTSVPEQIFIDWYDGSYDKPWKVWEKEGEREDWVPKDSVILYNFEFTKDLVLHPDIQKHLKRRYKELKRENQQKKKEEKVKQNEERQKNRKRTLSQEKQRAAYPKSKNKKTS